MKLIDLMRDWFGSKKEREQFNEFWKAKNSHYFENLSENSREYHLEMGWRMYKLEKELEEMTKQRAEACFYSTNEVKG